MPSHEKQLMKLNACEISHKHGITSFYKNIIDLFITNVYITFVIDTIISVIQFSNTIV